jgi:hypothetical protein
MHQSISVHVAEARHSDMVAAAARQRRALEARRQAPARQPRARRRSGPWQLVLRLHPQPQS